VETGLYNPLRESFARTSGSMELIVMGASRAPDYTWDGFINNSKVVLSDTLVFLNACMEQWEQVYAEHMAAEE
jgi:hypothetical protein